MPGVEIGRDAGSACLWRRIGGPLLVGLGLIAMPAVAQGVGEIDRSATAFSPPAADAPPRLAVMAEDRDYVIPFMALSEIDTDFNLVPPTSDEIIRDASIESIDAPFETKQAKK